MLTSTEKEVKRLKVNDILILRFKCQLEMNHWKNQCEILQQKVEELEKAILTEKGSHPVGKKQIEKTEFNNFKTFNSQQNNQNY